MKLNPNILAALILLTACQTSKKLTSTENTAITKIAFGSCSDQKRPQPLWDDIVADKPDVWVWLGDNIYGDSENMDTLKAKYHIQKSNPVYTQLRQSTKVIGVWDDHDYGVNDGGKEYPRKVESQQLMLNFMDVPADSPLRAREGGYSSHTYGPAGKKVKVILLDGRYFRDPLNKDADKKNLPVPDGDMLGEAQWSWFEKELTGSDADVHIIGCGVQFLAEEHPYEKWANFPKAHRRFFELLNKTKPKGAMLISGDRHIAEISKTRLRDVPYDLYDITSSGLTHVSKPHEEPNKHRVGDIVFALNYGLISIDWNAKPVRAKVEIKGDKGASYLTQALTF